MTEIVACFLIVLSFALGFFVGRAVPKQHVPQTIAINEDEDVLFDRFEALRRARFAPPIAPVYDHASLTSTKRHAPPKVPEKLAAELQAPIKNPKKDK